MRCNLCLSILSALGDKLLHHGLRRSASEQVSTLRFVDPPLDIFEIDLRPSSREFGHAELFERDSRIAEVRTGCMLECAISLDHPQHSNGKEELPLPLRFVLLPKLKRACRQLAIRLIRPVSAADDPRLPA